MKCPHCQSASTTEQEGRTAHGYRRFRCQDCERRFNERTGTVLNRLQVPSDLVFLVVFWRLRYKLSLRDLAEMFGIMERPPPNLRELRNLIYRRISGRPTPSLRIPTPWPNPTS